MNHVIALTCCPVADVCCRWYSSPSALGEDPFLEDAIMQELEVVLREKARLAEENRR